MEWEQYCFSLNERKKLRNDSTTALRVYLYIILYSIFFLIPHSPISSLTHPLWNTVA